MADPIHQYTASDLDIALLSSLPLFAHVPFDLLASIPYEDAVRYYHDGDVILQQGDQADCLVILLHGQARVLTDNIFLTARKPYDILGELAFINQTTRNATVIAQGTVQALVLRAALVEHLMTIPSLYPPTLPVSALFGNACEYGVLGVLAIVFDGSRQFFDLDYRTFLFLSLVCVRWFGETTTCGDSHESSNNFT